MFTEATLNHQEITERQSSPAYREREPFSTDDETNTEKESNYQTEDEEGPVNMDQQEGPMITGPMVATGNTGIPTEMNKESNTENIVPVIAPLPVEPKGDPHQTTKEIGINKPTPFDGDRKKVETFIQECRIYLHINKKIYSTDEAKVAFFLSFMSEKEALRWKQTFLRSITSSEGEMKFPTLKEFVMLLNDYFKPANQIQDAAHQMALLRQGNKSAEEIITQFRLLTSLAGYSAETFSDHLHLIEKLQKVLNPSLVKKIMLLDQPPTTINGWIEKAILIDSNYRMTMDVLGRLQGGKAKNEGKTGKPGWAGYFGTKKNREERDPSAMDIDQMSTEKRAALMKKGACFICEEPGHLARDHKDYVKKKESGNFRRNTPTPQKKDIKEIHALLQGLSSEETKDLLALQSSNQEKDDEPDF